MMLRSPMAWATFSMSARASTPPVGFCGELRMISLVRPVMRAASLPASMAKSRSSRERNGNRFAAGVFDHRLVDGEAGVGIDDLVAIVDQRQHGEEDDGLAAGDDHDLSGLTLMPRVRLT